MAFENIGVMELGTDPIDSILVLEGLDNEFMELEEIQVLLGNFSINEVNHGEEKNNDADDLAKDHMQSE
ncbi:hypothetical protein V6N12_017827 [Hibiscus sabdariffa]|uniref:Uncharacterized protein n=1 Tax=Hibiscus sabdariffa TaxID=183260 RepID=A0ABR2BBQ5_9ROSI